MWINFSISENEMQRIRNEAKAGLLRLPENRQLHRGDRARRRHRSFPYKGRITFADPSYNPQTGTFLIRASVDNPDGVLRPNQYVRTRLIGAVRPNSILVPQRAVQQGAQGPFRLGRQQGRQGGAAARARSATGTATAGSSRRASRPATRSSSTAALRLAPDAPVKATPYVPKPGAPETAPASRPSGASLAVHFATGKSTLDAEALRLLKGFAPAMKAGPNPIDITGFADRTGNHAANVELAKRRATAVRDALVAEGIPADRIHLKAPVDVTGSGSDDQARRVELAVGQ